MTRTRILKRMGLLFLISIVVLVVVTGARLLMLRNDLSSFKQYWNERAAEKIPENALIYVALGDSAAQGIGASRPEKGYVGLIEDALEQKNNRPVHVINLSVSGAKVQDVIDNQLPQLQKLALSDRAIITIDIGSNDMRTFDAMRFKGQFEELLAGLPQHTVIASLPFFGPDFHNHGGRQAKEANRIIYELTANTGHSVADIYTITEKNNSLLGYYAADFFHPNNKAYEDWFTAFWTVLDR